MVRRNVITVVRPPDGLSITVALDCGHRQTIQPAPSDNPTTAACDECTERRHNKDRRSGPSWLDRRQGDRRELHND